ncbi:hypothetical protein J3Q64DRAFT_1725177 [Phycomyces blakesleeanus]|uniref:GST N-terminal domain-containing protein n=2 Tax=Phycomyces blakesleeanus TaxID=4837 RepID=A0A162V7Y8_PHYB8|nr:hypothetical protein PHYBLDRAFT_161300 [Phycomyces blakesleeanus NRRL 1555(-)]OAD80662.1 hypothetical protein PHYBLDRAFT_161300 [Phycomyces blakesleeanus NRRL 1555(-)]|eukprot:XP_018298702.1 hypothetical protein PHYBLDRAFT_161300 [Phycomyces blakesleeanus NRRL 1555(-)]
MSNSIILHWFPESPFASRVAWALNYKNVDYKTVVVSQIEPRPLRRPLDGGYRKTPILQIDDHVFCDTKIILEELEKRYPEPSFYPTTRSGLPTQGLCKALEIWAANGLMYSVMPQFSAADIPESLYNDRAPLFGLSSKKEAIADAPYLAIEMQAQLGIADELLRGNSEGKEWFLDTSAPSLADFHFGMCLCFVLKFVDETLVKKRFPLLLDHQKRFLEVVKDKLGEGRPVLSEREALEASKSKSLFEPIAISEDSPLKAGVLVSVTPLDTGKIPVIGTLVQLTAQEVVIKRMNEEYGTDVFNHFPLVGFSVLPVKQ